MRLVRPLEQLPALANKPAEVPLWVLAEMDLQGVGVCFFADHVAYDMPSRPHLLREPGLLQGDGVECATSLSFGMRLDGLRELASVSAPSGRSSGLTGFLT